MQAQTHLLSEAELRQLTGATQAARQQEVLRENRVPFLLDARGRPQTTWVAVNGVLCGVSSAVGALAGPDALPAGLNLAALQGRR